MGPRRLTCMGCLIGLLEPTSGGIWPVGNIGRAWREKEERSQAICSPSLSSQLRLTSLQVSVLIIWSATTSSPLSGIQEAFPPFAPLSAPLSAPGMATGSLQCLESGGFTTPCRFPLTLPTLLKIDTYWNIPQLPHRSMSSVFLQDLTDTDAWIINRQCHSLVAVSGDKRL